MAALSKSVTYELTNADATVTGLAASATVTRWIRSLHVTNQGATTPTWSVGVNATYTGATALVATKTLAANATDAIYFGGKGRRVDNLNVRALASANSVVTLTIVYDEIDLT